MLLKLLNIITTICTLSFSEVTVKPESHYANQWETDSVFIGADIIVKDSGRDVIVKYKKAVGYEAVGELHFMKPGNDSSRFLFHNYIKMFPNEDSVINIGKFAAGTKLYFMYMLTDTASRWSDLKYKRLYSGQNRVGIDSYVTDRENRSYGRRWVAAAQYDSDNVKVGFSDYYSLCFSNLLFLVSNTVIGK